MQAGGGGGSWEGGYANDADVKVRALPYEPDPVLRRIGPPEGWLPSGEIDHAYISRQSMLNRHKRGLSDSVGAMRESMASDRGTFSNSAQARAYLERIDPPLKTFDLELMTLGAGGLVTRGAVNGAVALGNGAKAYGNALIKLGTEAVQYGIKPALIMNWHVTAGTTAAFSEAAYLAGGVPTPFGAEVNAAGAGVRGVPNSALRQTGGGGGDFIPSRSFGVGDSASISYLKETGAFPGPNGVVVQGPHSFGDLYELSTLNGRTIEFGLGQRIGTNGQIEHVVNNGGISRVGFPSDVYPIAHTHPTVNKFQTSPSNADLDIMQRKVSTLLENNPKASIPPHYIIYSPTEYTAFSPLPYDYFNLAK
ncbi:hypothetical protein [Chitinimonas sp. BJB300]|uniref:hypothetical protein n=1 Tax=Chitinimonas sp. BJB300 TaxID=1559339 RepID=UPI000C123937|nr:hypothetical protein [Chitinimonas sp. BJB300]TSJ84657.1 hypothetical protein FG002_019250 [Chitinimonas sp. BJB300]